MFFLEGYISPACDKLWQVYSICCCRSARDGEDGQISFGRVATGRAQRTLDRTGLVKALNGPFFGS